MEYKFRPSVDLVELIALTEQEMSDWRSFLKEKNIYPTRVAEHPETVEGVRRWYYSGCIVYPEQSKLVLQWIEKREARAAA